MAKIKSKMLEDLPITKILFNQVDIVGSTGSPETPYILNIYIKPNPSFILPYVSVLIKIENYYTQGIPGVDYIIEYHSSTEMTVKLFFSGECKINY